MKAFDLAVLVINNRLIDQKKIWIITTLYGGDKRGIK